MQTYRTETKVSKDGTLTLKELPFQPGAKVEVIVRSYELEAMPRQRYPLRGQPLCYDNPFESVAEDVWQAKK
jgi:hypothetical protein